MTFTSFNPNWESILFWKIKPVFFSLQVICRELGLGYAQSGAQTNYFNANSSTEEILSGVSCRGNERFLSECYHDATNFCPGTGNNEVAAVVCVDKQADLAPDLYALMSSVYLEDKHLFFLQVSAWCVNIDKIQSIQTLPFFPD